ncbi:MAG: fructose-6-phosphate aldolase [Candidatus Latescibacteria bacterium]|nr:fructose-6-phosphate aldolase [Candidatus Latescibacterota bacterium]NIM22073.1 fructose-6-phosphate aldolase [Candidatus Latescibacterota bacterium]NIM66092.1 fructose-6-phosphate aldolase [Candidatus Latescibacterota bacterium]NIO02500.1 fructose-6-phosphate aldolase [Candidatus Latescibacterota bacterium]NIO29411.1 fructose-6-phosphate aldolase [Candidatus Latescibacterota bacterium]
MKLFLDTANIEQIREVAALGILDGVTTNPTLMSKEKGNYRESLKEICDIVRGPVSAEVVAEGSEEMVLQARDLAKISEHIVIKIPLIAEGLKAVRVLSAEDVKTNVTLCFSANQGILAAKAGATYLSPFIGRIDDVGQPGMDLIADLIEIFENYAFATQIIVASVRHPLHVLEAARLGADVVTVPHKVMMQMLKHPLTDVGIEKFNEDWKKVISR